MRRSTRFIDGVVASGPAAEHADKVTLYGQFVADWITETIDYRPGGLPAEPAAYYAPKCEQAELSP
jgi:hypothetical protein